MRAAAAHSRRRSSASVAQWPRALAQPEALHRIPAEVRSRSALRSASTQPRQPWSARHARRPRHRPAEMLATRTALATPSHRRHARLVCDALG